MGSRILNDLGRWRVWVRRIDWVKTCLVLLPFLWLAAYLAEAAFPVPGFLLPERRYLALGRRQGTIPVDLPRESFAVLPDGLTRMPSSRAGQASLQASLPDVPPLEPVIRDLSSGIRPFQRARIVLDAPPLASELEALQKAADGIPLTLEVAPLKTEAPIQSVGVRYAPSEKRVAFDLLLAPEARAFTWVEVRAKETLLFRAAGAELPQDLVLRLSVDRGEAATVTARFLDAAGKGPGKQILLGADAEEQPRVLIISDKGAGSSFIEALYPSRRVTLPDAANLDLLAFELVVLDGIPIAKIHGKLLAGLLGLQARRTGSLLFVADSPEFGKKGDNPELEAILPVTLLQIGRAHV